MYKKLLELPGFEKIDPSLAQVISEIREVIQHHLSEEHLEVFGVLISSDLRIRTEPIEEKAQFEPTWL